jgi:protein TonB
LRRGSAGALRGKLDPVLGKWSELEPMARMQLALLGSVLVHALVLSLTFSNPGKQRLDNFAPPLEVVLVNSKTVVRPHAADAFAQANLDGGGNTEAARRAKTPLPVQKNTQPSQEVVPEAQRVEQLEREAKRLMTQLQAKASVEAVEAKAQAQDKKVEAPSAGELLARSRDVVRLEAQISQQVDAYQQRPKRRFIGARTQEFRFARYVEDWRMKVERIGTVNYPEAARDQRIFGNLILTVSIKSDGTLENIEINRSSGENLLDSAAVRIVRLSAPFAPFPPDIHRDTDILSITRTWMFTRADQFVSE